jgi:nicotinate-nucleotide adenylyltransferase
MEQTVKRLGILGGSFDPIHLGHLMIAQEALWQCKLDAILFVVTANPPHKRAPEADVEDRFRMVELAVSGEPAFEPSRIEIERGGESYTAETLRELRRIYPNASFCLIVGADSVLDFSVWKEPEAVIDMAQVAVAPRPGFDLSKMEPRLQGKTVVFQSPTLALSSTMIRKRLHEGKPVRFLVPDVVEKYIRERGLYSD